MEIITHLPDGGNPVIDFAALDFETYTHDRLSACAVGVVIVRHGVIVQKYYSLINPISREGVPLSKIHSINSAMLDHAPAAAEVFGDICRLVSGLPLVCHNASFDTGILKATLAELGQDSTSSHCYDTYRMTGERLDTYCMKNDISLSQHHNALADAEACAAIMLHLQAVRQPEASEEEMSDNLGHKMPSESFLEKRKIEKNTLRPLSDEEIKDKTSIFYKARTVITGTFTTYPMREDLAMILKSLGADINTAISRRTNIVVMGSGAGPKKIEKINEINANCDEAHKIKVLNEKELLQVFVLHDIIKYR